MDQFLGARSAELKIAPIDIWYRFAGREWQSRTADHSGTGTLTISALPALQGACRRFVDVDASDVVALANKTATGIATARFSTGAFVDNL